MPDRPERDAGDIGPGPTLYEITYAHAHRSLSVGDLVRLVRCPDGVGYLLRTDWTFHQLMDDANQYVHLRAVELETDGNEHPN